MTGRYDEPAFADWQTLLPEQATVLEDVEVTGGTILALDRDDVLTRLTAYDPDGRRLRELPLPAFGNVSGLAYDLRTDTAYATLASHTAPLRAYALRRDARSRGTSSGPTTRRSTPRRSSPSGVYVPAKDGAKIPVFVVHRKDATMNGDNPGAAARLRRLQQRRSQPFYIGTLSTLRQPRRHLRRRRHPRRLRVRRDAGTGRGCSSSKQNTLRRLRRGRRVADRGRSYTTPARLAIMGGSNGGLLVGAAITQRPDLFRAAVCQVPLLDMMRYHRSS